jgi:hypothetical protein
LCIARFGIFGIGILLRSLFDLLFSRSFRRFQVVFLDIYGAFIVLLSRFGFGSHRNLAPAVTVSTAVPSRGQFAASKQNTAPDVRPTLQLATENAGEQAVVIRYSLR